MAVSRHHDLRGDSLPGLQGLLALPRPESPSVSKRVWNAYIACSGLIVRKPSELSAFDRDYNRLNGFCYHLLQT